MVMKYWAYPTNSTIATFYHIYPRVFTLLKACANN